MISTMLFEKELIFIKIHYFLFHGALSGVIPILSVQALQLGIQPTILGLAYSLSRLLAVAIKPLVGAIGDRFKNHLCLLSLLIFLTLSCMASISFIPKKYFDISSCNPNSSSLIMYQNHEMKFPCYWNCSETKDFELIVDFETMSSSYLENNLTAIYVNISELQHPEKHCNDISAVFECAENCSESNNIAKYTPGEQLWLFAPLMIIGWVAFASATTISDATCYSILKDNPYKFGEQRMFGSIGWMIFTLLAGYFNQLLTGAYAYSDYSAGFFIMLLLLILDEIVVFKLDFQGIQKVRATFKDIPKLLIMPRVICFLLHVFMNGVFIGLVWLVLYPHLTGLGANPLLLGLISTVQCVAEIPFFFFAGYIISKMGHLTVLSMASACFGIRFMCYYGLSNPWFILPVEILQGPAFAAFYSAFTSYAADIAPPGTSTTMQGLVGAVFEALGVGVGFIIGGIGLYDSNSLFFYASLTAFATAFCTGAIYFVLDFIQKPLRRSCICEPRALKY